MALGLSCSFNCGTATKLDWKLMPRICTLLAGWDLTLLRFARVCVCGGVVGGGVERLEGLGGGGGQGLGVDGEGFGV